MWLEAVFCNMAVVSVYGLRQYSRTWQLCLCVVGGGILEHGSSVCVVRGDILYHGSSVCV